MPISDEDNRENHEYLHSGERMTWQIFEPSAFWITSQITGSTQTFRLLWTSGWIFALFHTFLLDSHLRRRKINIEVRIGSWPMLEVWKEETEELGHQSPEQNLNPGHLKCETVVLITSRQISVSSFLYTRFRTVPGRLSVGCVHVGRRLQLIWFHCMQISPNLARVSMYGLIPWPSVGCRYVQSATTSATATPEVWTDLSANCILRWDLVLCRRILSTLRKNLLSPSSR
jgi:hypothetical protein